MVLRSSVEAKFQALALGIYEGMWLQRLLNELGVTIGKPTKMLCNRVAIRIAKNSVHHDRTKHIEIDRHFINEKIEKQIVELALQDNKLQISSPTLFQEQTLKY